MRLSDIFTRLRRFLRDPDGTIWSDADLLRYWNDAQTEFAVLVPELLVRVRVVPYPPQWDMTYMHGWERTWCRQELVSYSRPGVYWRMSRTWELRGMVLTYPWEAGYRSDDASPADEGYRYTHPWEAFMATAESPPVPLPERCDRILYLGYDEETIGPSTRREISMQDTSYKTVQGEAAYYYRPDAYSNSVVLWPKPTTANWDTGTGVGIGDAIIGETFSVGTDPDETGNLLLIFAEMPAQWISSEQRVDYPGWALHYLEAGTLERCFGADCDGYIPSLRDYWRFRKQIGLQVCRRWKSMRQQDRDIRIGGLRGREQARKRYPRLPAAYGDPWV